MIAKRSSGKILTLYPQGSPTAVTRIRVACMGLLTTSIFSFSCALVPKPSLAQEPAASAPLTQQIDHLIASDQVSAPQSPLADGPLLKRLYLDLIGVPPTLDEMQQYLADSNPDRFVIEVDRLLERPEFVEHWVDRFDVALMERRPNTNIPQDQWRAWLREKIATQVPINQWMADLIVADGASGANRAAARFILDRDTDPHLITRDIGRIYFGMDLQCAQCHDHPNVDSYLQADYHGILGFVATLSAIEVQEGDAKIKMISEKSAGDAPFESVFNRGQMRRVLPHVPQEAELPQPWTVPGEDYEAAAVAGHPQRPKHSRREQLASLVREGNHQRFQQTLANRLWAMMFGRGVIHPIDFIHSATAPRHPDLLPLLGQGLAAHQYQLKPFLRDLVLTQGYRAGLAPLRYDEAALSETANADVLVPGLQPPAWLAETASQASQRKTELAQRIESAREQLASRQSEVEEANKAAESVEAERVTALANVDAARNAFAQTVDARGKKAAEQATAQAEADKLRDHVSKVQTAFDSTAAALTALPEDAQLTEAQKLIQQRLDAAQAALAPAEQTLQTKNSELAALDQQRTEQRTALVAAQTAADEVEQRRRPLRQVVIEKRATAIQAEQYLAYLRGEEAVVDQWIACNNAFAMETAEIASNDVINPVTASVDEIATTLIKTDATSDKATAANTATISQQLSQLEQITQQLTATRERLDQLQASLSQQQQTLAKKFQDQLDAVTALETLLGERFAAKSLVPMSPEQIGWSTLVVTGVMNNYIAKHAAELEKATPATPEQLTDAAWVKARHDEAVRLARTELAGNITIFVNLYGAGPGQPQGDFFATADQALFTSNGGTLFSWSAPSAANVTQQVSAATEPIQAATLLYRGILGRDPLPAETAAVDQFLQSDPNQRARLAQEMVWGLMAGAEFRFRP